MKQINVSALVPHIIAIVIFLALSAAYFSPELGGKKMRQSDITQFQGMSKEIKDYREETGEEPLWTNSMFGGMPAYQISVRYPNPVLKPVDKVMRIFSNGGLGKVFLYMISFYLLCLALGFNPWLGVLGGIAFGLSSYHLIILEAGHNSKAVAIGYIPGLAAGFFLLFERRKYLLGTIVSALFLGLELMSNHPQITFYIFLVLLICGIAYTVDAILKKQLPHLAKALGLFVFASLLALGTSASRLMTTLEYSESTIRGPSELSAGEGNSTSGLDKDYATAWSYGIPETWSLLVPNANGGGSGVIGNDASLLESVSRQNREIFKSSVNRYWGDQTFTSGPVYIGAIIILLALFGMWYVEGPLKYSLILSAVLAIMLAWGKNFMPLTDWFLENFPMYNKFRAVSMTLVIVEFVFPLLAVLGLHSMITKRAEIQKDLKPFFVISGLVAGVLILMLLSPTMFTSFYSNASPNPAMDELQFMESQLAGAKYSAAQVDTFLNDMIQVRKSIFTGDVMRSLLFVILGVLSVWLFLTAKIKMVHMAIGLSLFTLIDLWSIDKRYLNEENFISNRQAANPIPEQGYDQAIAQDPDLYYRVFNATTRPDQDAMTSYYHKSLGGYHGAKLRRYQEVLTYHLSQNNIDVINMLNTKYVIVQDQDGSKRVQRNPGALGNVWFVNGIKTVANADEEIDALGSFDPSIEATLDQRFDVDQRGLFSSEDAKASITLTDYDPRHMEYKSNSSRDEFAVFSDIYYQPGWNAYLDGQLTDHVRVNYILRGMKVPAGTHDIEFKFEPTSFATGNMIVYISSVLMLILAGFVFYAASKGKQTQLD